MREPFTADLDVLVTFRPWLSRKDWQFYRDAIESEPSLTPGLIESIEREPKDPVSFFGEDALLLKLAYGMLCSSRRLESCRKDGIALSQPCPGGREVPQSHGR